MASPARNSKFPISSVDPNVPLGEIFSFSSLYGRLMYSRDLIVLHCISLSAFIRDESLAAVI